MKKLLFLGLTLATLAGCNKTRQNANRLEGEVWELKSLKIDGDAVAFDEAPRLEFSDCDIYEEICYGEWKYEGEHAEFVWQFRKDGEEFIMSNQSVEDHNHEHGDDHGHEHEHEKEMSALDLSQELSGTFDVTESKRKSMKFSSTTTLGHTGETVEMEWEKID